jgi:hypothetical protein
MERKSQVVAALTASIGQGFAALVVVLRLFYNPILVLVSVFIYFAATSEEQSTSFAGFASKLTVKDTMEPSPLLLAVNQPISEAIGALLSSLQKESLVVDAGSQNDGIFESDAMIIGPRDRGTGIPVSETMRASEPIFTGEPLVKTFTHMQQRGAKAEVVSKGAGRIVGVPTQENIATMIMLESACSGCRFGS